MPCPGNNAVHLVSWQLSAFAWLCALSHLYLDLLCVDQILRGNSKAAGCHLFNLAVQRNAVLGSLETGLVLAALAGVAPASQLVECQRNGLVSLFAQGSERHCAAHEPFHDALLRLHLFKRNGILLESEEVPQEQRFLAGIYQGGELLEFGVAAFARRNLQRCDGFRSPGVADSVLAESVLSHHRKDVASFLIEGLRVQADGVLCNCSQAYSFNS